MIHSQVRPMIEADLELVLGWRNHPDVRRFMYTTHVISGDEHQAWFERANANPAVTLLVYEKDRDPSGFICFNETRSGGIADWGFYLAPETARGTGRELGIATLKYGFEKLSFHKVCGQALAFNEQSDRFHRKLGFIEEGRLREHHYDGIHYHDIICFGLLRSEWQPGRGEGS